MITDPYINRKVSFNGRNTHILRMHDDGITIVLFGVCGATQIKWLEEPIPEESNTKERNYTEKDMRKAIEFGEQRRTENSFIEENYGSPYISYNTTSSQEIESWLKEI